MLSFSLEQLCALTSEIQEKITGLVQVTSFKCRKSGYGYPNAVRVLIELSKVKILFQPQPRYYMPGAKVKVTVFISESIE